MSDALCESYGEYNPRDYLWIVVVGGIFSFVMAYGNGANDVANAFATSVGSKTLKLWQAVCIAAVLEFTGSLMGASVTSTIAKGITDPNLFADEPAVLMLGMLTALMGAGGWVLIATRLGLPVSTTHSIVGAIMGFAIVAQGWSAVNWEEVGFIVLSWIISPVLAGLVSASVFYCVRRFILRSANSVARGLNFYPLLVFVTVVINAFYITYKGLSGFNIDDTLPVWQGLLIAIGIGIGLAIIIHFTFVPWLAKRLQTHSWGATAPATTADYDNLENPRQSLINTTQVATYQGTDKATTGDEAPQYADEAVAGSSSSAVVPIDDEKSFFKAQWRRMMGEDMEETAFESEHVKEMHRNAELFDGKAEHLFSYLQVVTACFMSFAHGANDVANSIGPFSAIVNIYNDCNVSSTSTVPLWILAMGGGGIVIGLLTYGYHVMRSIGIELIKITPARGFCIELASATVVISASMLSLPISSTHCQVGSTVAVGLLEGKSGFNAMLFIKTFTSWVFTLLFASIVTAGIFSFAYFAP